MLPNRNARTTSSLTSKGSIIDLLVRHGTMSRVEIARRTGLTRGMITISVGELLAEGIVHETGTAASSGGRRPVQLRLGGRSVLVMGIALEDDLAIVNLMTLDGEVLHRTVRALPYGTATDAAVAMIGVEVETLRAGHPDSRIIAGGLALGAHVEPDHDAVTSRGFGWVRVPLHAKLKVATAIPWRVIDNVQAAALGELWGGGREDNGTIAYLYAGRGAGGAFVLDGDIYLGRGNMAASLGSMLVGSPVDDPTPVHGHLESLTQPTAIVEWLRVNRSNYPGTSLPECFDERDALRVVSEELRAGDPLALAVTAHLARVLGYAVTNLVNLLNPDRVIIGGPIAALGAPLIDLIEAAARRDALPDAWQGTRVLGAQPRDQSISIGAGAAIVQRTPWILAGK